MPHLFLSVLMQLPREARGSHPVSQLPQVLLLTEIGHLKGGVTAGKIVSTWHRFISISIFMMHHYTILPSYWLKKTVIQSTSPKSTLHKSNYRLSRIFLTVPICSVYFQWYVFLISWNCNSNFAYLEYILEPQGDQTCVKSVEMASTVIPDWFLLDSKKIGSPLRGSWTMVSIALVDARKTSLTGVWKKNPFIPACQLNQKDVIDFPIFYLPFSFAPCIIQSWYTFSLHFPIPLSQTYKCVQNCNSNFV